MTFQHGLQQAEYELTDALTGAPLAILDLAWPNGLQEGYSQPVVLLIDESQETEEAANRAGQRSFKDVKAFCAHVQQEILALPSASQEELVSQRD